MEPRLDVHNGAEEVGRDGIIPAGSQYVVPYLLTLSFFPGVSALIDGDAELSRLPEEFKEPSFGSFQ